MEREDGMCALRRTVWRPLLDRRRRPAAESGQCRRIPHREVCKKLGAGCRKGEPWRHLFPPPPSRAKKREREMRNATLINVAERKEGRRRKGKKLAVGHHQVKAAFPPPFLFAEISFVLDANRPTDASNVSPKSPLPCANIFE